MQFRSLKLKIVLIFLIITTSLQLKKLNQAQQQLQGNPTQQQYQSSAPLYSGANSTATSGSLAQGNTTVTVAAVNVSAAGGTVAVGVSQANAKTDTVNSQASAAAIAAPTGNDVLVQNNVLQATSQQLTQQNQYGGNGTNLQNNQYDQNTLITTQADGSQIVQNNHSSTVQNNTKISTGDTTVSDQSLSNTNIAGDNISNINTLQQTDTTNILINADNGQQTIIVEKIISDDSRVIIVTGANYLIGNLVESDAQFIEELLAGSCNCDQIKDFVVELLTEAV